ncbi:MAG: DNA topoisomerase, partial [Thermoplasmata archaeon]
MNILVICEKQNAAERIASILSGGTEKKKKEDKIEIYTFSKGKDSYTIIPLKGHIVKPDFPVKYNQWLRISPKRLIDIEPEITIDAKEYVKLLQKEGKKAERVIIATDYDREGELIGLEALELIKKVNKNIEVKRARFSAFTEKEVTSSFKKLGDIDKNLADSARSRQFIDLTWGAVLTRFLSMASYRLGEDFLSVGRVQSPTLSLIVKRDDEIEKFVPQPYWVISVELEGTEKGKPVQFKAKCKEEKFLKKKEAEEKFKRIKAAKEGKVVEAKVIIREDNVITPFNTTAFLTAAAELGFTPARAMEIAEFLYTSGYISYPRTDNTVYPDSMDFMEILKLLEKTEFKPLSKKIQAQDEIKPSKGKKESKDHPPIYPTGALKKGAVEEHEYKIYELIVRRFLATLSKPSKIKAVSLEIDLKKELVVAKGMQIVEKGWREFYPYIHVQEAHIPEMKKGEKVKKLGETLEEKYTKPPPRISLGGLIA